MLDAGEYSSSSSAECLMSGNWSISRRKKNKSKNKRRFSDDQIKSLETIFDTETKLEPKKKLQLARELGLQPRQVAIWFQNKRARWKSKQLERDYGLLQSNYDNLVEQFESLKKERQTLFDQLQKLNDLIDKSDAKEAGHEACGDGGLVNDDDLSSGAANMNMNKTGDDDEFEVKKPISEFLDLERREYGGVLLNGVLSDDDDDDDDVGGDGDESSRRNPASYLGLEKETDQLPLNILEAAGQSCNLREPEEWSTLESDGLLDQPSNGYKWWDFWS